MSKRRWLRGAVIDKKGDGAAVIRHDARDLPLNDGTVDLIVTSPPYFAMRSYRDDDGHIEGQIGGEPTPDQFVDALSECMEEWGRVLKPGGSVWINLGDKYGEKSLMGLPWRFAIRQIDTGWILRAEVIWSKPNGLPESVTDRVRRSHEQWFHFTKEPRYFSAVDEIREPHKLPTNGAVFGGREIHAAEGSSGERRYGHNTYDEQNPLGRLPGSVWTIPTEPLIIPDEVRVLYDLPDHFAAFPQEWPRRIILGWSPPNGVVLDPFGGTGTTAGVARVLGRYGISNDISAAYNRLAAWRIWESGHFERGQEKWVKSRTGGPLNETHRLLMTVPGVGEVAARNLVEKFGGDVFRIRDEVIDSSSPKLAESLSAMFNQFVTPD